jgi:hypothetical protein
MDPRDPSERVRHGNRADDDWALFAGCESDAPLVAYPREETAIVVDGATLHVFDLAETGPITSQRVQFADAKTARVAAEDLVEKLIGRPLN